jgi:ABC-type transport system involved in multi-copper enzyme maturation permease subunit
MSEAMSRGGGPAFWHLLHAEWTKFRSVRGWLIGTAVAALMIVLFAVLAGASATGHDAQPVPLGPDGEPVSDSFYFLHQPLDGDGRITVAVTSLTTVMAADRGEPDVTVPWAKAGLIIKAGTGPGASYAAIMVTGGHGVRIQDNYLHDRAGPPGPVSAADPRWLRLTRAGDTITGESSADGTHWSRLATVRLAGLPATVQAGLFVACPPYVHGRGSQPAAATAVFGRPDRQGQWPQDRWDGEQVGAGTATFSGYPPVPTGGAADIHGPRMTGGSVPSGDGFTVTGAGDIAPATRSDLPTAGVVGDLLFGTFPALIALCVVGALFITTEYRHTLIGTTLTASPHRTRVLAAKAIVLGCVTGLTSLPATALAIPIGERIARAHGIYLFPVSTATAVRVELGTAALLAVTAVFALGVGTVLRRSAATVTTVVVALVLPHLLVLTPILPASAQRWLTLVTPDAAFAVQQTLTPYPHVDGIYTPTNGYHPLGPWAGLAVLCGYAAVALGLAAVLLRRRDA